MAKRLVNVHFDGKQIELTPAKLDSRIRNYYTVIVGKNGIGKSRLLAELVTLGSYVEYFQPEFNT